MALAPDAHAQGGTRTQARCAGQPITEVVIRTQAPAYGGLFARSPLLGRLVTSMHVTTAPSVIRNFVLLQRGERCNPLLRSESERILRAMPFIADASITAFPDGLDGVRLEVVTTDEPQVVVGAGLQNASPYVTSLVLGDANLLGNAVYASAAWREGFFYRDGFAGHYTNYQLWGRPYQLDLQGTRRELGSEWLAGVTLPFFSDVQRYGWRVEGGSSNDYIRFLRRTAEPASVRLERRYFDAGALFRVGRPGQLGVFGGQLSVEDAQPATEAVLVTDSGLVTDTTSALANRYSPSRSVRLNVLLGFRALHYKRVIGFDALRGSQDVRIGVQLQTAIGLALPSSTGAARRETYGAVNLYAGAGSPSSFAAVQVDLEGRRPEGGGWDDVLTSGRGAVYLKPHSRHTIIADVLWGAGWRTRTPYQLSLGARLAGLRGYEAVPLGGGRRLVERLEERWRIGNFRGTADGGVGVFTDVGQVWAGDVPLGTSSGTRQSVGFSLMAAVPPGSQRMWRVDVAFPLDRRDGAGVQLRFSNDDRTRVFSVMPSDIRIARQRGGTQSFFSSP